MQIKVSSLNGDRPGNVYVYSFPEYSDFSKVYDLIIYVNLFDDRVSFLRTSLLKNGDAINRLYLDEPILHRTPSLWEKIV